MRVVVTGAGGRTGSLVFEKLLKAEEFEPVGFVRDDRGKNKLKALGAADDQIVVGDLLAPGGAAALAAGFAGADAVVLATSAVPVIRKLSLIPVIWAKITGKTGVRPQFTFKENQAPEQIDWRGAVAQIDAAKAAGVRKFVCIGSMGGTQRDNFLNTIGDGNILVWKRRAEAYLVASGLDYTIVHPGGLTDAPGGEREVVLGVDDALLGGAVRSIPRADVAELCVRALAAPAAARRAVDAVARPPGEGAGPTADWAALFAGCAGDCSYADMDGDAVLAAALKGGKA